MPSHPAHAATIKDIAAVLGMAHSTVSRALNNRTHVSKETRQKVLEAAERLGYVPNRSARMLRGEADLQVGLLIPDIQNHFYSHIAQELAERCRRAGFRLLLALTEDDPDRELDEIRALIEGRVSGVFAAPSSNPRPESVALLKSRPSVQLVRQAPGLHSTAICMADQEGCDAAAEHLLALGHRRIGYVGQRTEVGPGRERLEGFIRAHERHGLAPDQDLIELTTALQPHGREAVGRLLSRDERPTALVLASSQLTIGGLSGIADTRLRMPDDISVVGYGDSVWFDLIRPQLTAVSLPMAALCEAAAERLLGDIEGDFAEPTAEVVRIAPHLVVRGSTAPPP
jgi:LacI family transcriptional regulator